MRFVRGGFLFHGPIIQKCSAKNVFIGRIRYCNLTEKVARVTEAEVRTHDFLEKILKKENQE
jgi:hypothetical protein